MIFHLVLAVLATVFAVDVLAALPLPGWARALLAAGAALGALSLPPLALHVLAVAGAAGLLRALVTSASPPMALARMTRRTPDLPRR